MATAFDLSRAMSGNDTCLVGVDVGGTNLRVGVIAKDGVVWEHRVQADFGAICRRTGPQEALEIIMATLSDAIGKAISRYPISAVGIGFPGFIDPVDQRILQSPNLPGLLEVDLAGLLTQILGIPVLVENDALAAGYGEFMVGDKGLSSLIYLGLGTGVGGSVILDGKPYSGSHGVSMEVGHIIVEPEGRLCGCGNRGCLEQYASASGVALTYMESTGKNDITSATVSAFAQAGDLNALAAYRRGGEVLAQGLASILKVLDVPQVVIGGGMSQSWPLMQAAFDARLQQDLIPVLRNRIAVRISQSDDKAGMIGAALLANAQLI